MCDLSEMLSGSEEVSKDDLLSLTLDEIEKNPDLLEMDRPAYLRRSNRKPRHLGSYDPFGEIELTDERDIRLSDEDVYSRAEYYPDSSSDLVPQIDYSNRSHRHFDMSNGKLFAYNLIYGVTDQDLWTLFSTFGKLKRAAINYDETARSRGNALIVYENRSDAMRAFRALDGHPLDGRKLRLKVIAGLSGSRDPNKSFIYKRKGDERLIDNVECFADTEKVTPNDLDFELEEYMKNRKKAKTWNYY